jgi:hypothetical protein
MRSKKRLSMLRSSVLIAAMGLVTLLRIYIAVQKIAVFAVTTFAMSLRLLLLSALKIASIVLIPQRGFVMN